MALRRGAETMGRMSENDIEIGPVDYLVVEWPPGKQPTGEGLRVLVDLTERGLIRVLDLAFVQKEQDGSINGLLLADLDSDGTLDLAEFEGASSGMLGQDDFDEAGSALEPGASAAILVYENRWAAPFVSAVRRSGAQVVGSGRISVDDLLEALDQAEAAEA
jgi:Family of unknown function (DUF6325)